MKFFLIAFAVIAAVAADVSHLPTNEYLPPVQQQQEVVQVAAPTNEYLPPVQQAAPVQQHVVEAAPAHELADDGYRYKTHRRVVYRRNRRDVSHLPTNEYLPPVQQQETVQVAAPTNEYLPPVQQAAPVQQHVVEAAPAHELADDGYRYKTHRRVVYRRNRRDVSHLPTNEYLPPTQENTFVQESAPVEQVAYAAEEVAPAHELADDGYRYKTNRRVVYRRNRRDVSHLPTNEYLPPVQENTFVQESAPVEQVAYAAQEVAPAHELADDGYRYKTNRRVVYRRNRRDVSHLPTNEYLPPVQENTFVQESAPVEQVAYAAQEVAPAHELADDGYRYKTNRRVVYRRNRRDVSHLPTNEYLPPVQENTFVQESAPVEQVAYAAQEVAPAHELADDGYRYKTNRRVVYRRNRRDVSHLPTNEYLPPQQDTQSYAPVEEVPVVVNVEEAAPAHELADDGYRYKTNRRVVYRQRVRRDVSHLPTNEYLPPVQENTFVQESAPVEQVAYAAQEVAPAHELADDGYRYKTNRRVVYRRNRRDVSHLPTNEYLPPTQENTFVQESAPVEQVSYATQEVAPAHELADDGYRYKTNRRVVYRRH